MQDSLNFRIALAQINTTVGDLEGNYAKIIKQIHAAEEAGCHLVTFPELAITGYPPEDLVLRKQFIHDQRSVLDKIVAQVQGITCVIGFVDSEDDLLFNSAAIIQDSKIKAIYHKIQLPNYSVFDEQRYFDVDNTPIIIEMNKLKIGVSICEDIWIPNGVTEAQAFEGGAHILLNISASPYVAGKGYERIELMQKRAKQTRSIVAYNNLVGGQDELVFDGQSLIIDANGNVCCIGSAFEEEMIIHDINGSQHPQERALGAHKRNLSIALKLYGFILSTSL